MSDTAKNMGRALREVRLASAITQHELAVRAKLTVNYLSLLENGHRRASIRQLEAIAGALDVPVSFITTLADAPAEKRTLKTRRVLTEMQELVRDAIVTLRDLPAKKK